MTHALLITDVRPWGGRARDVAVLDGVLAADLPDGLVPELVDGRGRLLLPSFSDVHVHLDSTRIGLPFRPHTGSPPAASRGVSSSPQIRSHAPIRPIPPARTCPSTTPITGRGHSRMARSTAVISAARPAAISSGDAPDTSDRSAPAQNVRPAWVSTTMRTEGSAAASSRRPRSWVTSVVDSALRLCGEFSVSRATRSVTLYSTS